MSQDMDPPLLADLQCTQQSVASNLVKLKQYGK